MHVVAAVSSTPEPLVRTQVAPNDQMSRGKPNTNTQNMTNRALAMLSTRYTASLATMSMSSLSRLKMMAKMPSTKVLRLPITLARSKLSLHTTSTADAALHTPLLRSCDRCWMAESNAQLPRPVAESKRSCVRFGRVKHAHCNIARHAWLRLTDIRCAPEVGLCHGDAKGREEAQLSVGLPLRAQVLVLQRIHICTEPFQLCALLGDAPFALCRGEPWKPALQTH